MRAAFCLFKYSPFSGLARDMLRIAERLRDRGHEVSIFAGDWRGEPARAFPVEIVRPRALTNHGRAESYHRELEPRLRGRFDTVVGFNKIPQLDVYYAADACLAARARYDRPAMYRLTPRYLGYRRLEAAVFDRGSATHVLALSDHAVSEFQEFYGTPDSRFTVLPPALQDRYRDFTAEPGARAEARRGAGAGEGDALILMVGSGFRTKGVDRAIRALGALPPELRDRTHLVVAGSGRAAPFRSLARACGIASRVRFLGGRDDVPELMSAADLLLHPAYNENTGAVLLEAMATGLPVLTTDVCGYARHVSEADAGIVLASPFSQRLLDGALEAMLRADRSRWRRNGRSYANQPLFFSMPDRAADAIERTAGAGRRRTVPAPGFFYVSDRLGFTGSEATPDAIMAMPGEVFREAPARRTLRFVRGGRGYFLKTHRGVGWIEIAKNLACLKHPVLGAQNEWHALHLLKRRGLSVPEPLGFGSRGRNPARRESFVIMEDVAGSTSLETLFGPGGQAVDVGLRRALISQVARIARNLHTNGVNHRDFYLCHFLVDQNAAKPGGKPAQVVLIDLHRAQIRRRTPMRWVVKDLGGLYFSAMDVGLSRNDLFRFIGAYSGRSLRAALDAPVDWRRVRRRAFAMRRRAAKARP